MKAKAGGYSLRCIIRKPKSQVKKSYECTGAMAVQEPSEADMDFLEQIFKKSDKPAPKTRAVSKASEIAPPPARTIAIAKETTPPPSKSKVQVLAQPKAMEIHFHESEFSVPPKSECYHGWVETEQAILGRKPYIVTTQMGRLGTDLFEKCYRIFVHPMEGECYEIRLGNNSCTDREVKMKNNLFKLWLAEEFSV